MNKHFIWGKLKIELIVCLIFALAISVGLFFLSQETGAELLDNYFNKTSYIENQTNQAITEFQSYVADHDLTLQDRDKMAKWVHDEKYVNIYIYKENHLVYAFDNNSSSDINEGYQKVPVLSGEPVYTIKYADTDARMYLESFFEYKYYYIVLFLGVVLSFFSFILIMVFFINRKTSYIGRLETEIKILEGGNLDYQITVSGHDELSSLAQSINEMRKAFIERLENEDQARQANSELVTAMSHDLRTPLTALVGYLDIIEFKKYRTDDDLAQYIHSSREKAYQIKHLSDKLFEYFTVFNTNEDDLALESFDGNQLVDQIIDEQLLLLQNNEFQFEYLPCNTPFCIKINLISIRRVFDNIFSNIIKYADQSMPIKIKCQMENQRLSIDIENHINHNSNTVNSTGIGMKTCKKIIEQHEGKISVTTTADLYSIHILLHCSYFTINTDWQDHCMP